MSDLSRLRARLVRIERQGKRLNRELAELKEARLDGTEALTRTEERRILRLEAELDEQRADWRRVRVEIQAEELRLLHDPLAFLKFT